MHDIQEADTSVELHDVEFIQIILKISCRYFYKIQFSWAAKVAS